MKKIGWVIGAIVIAVCLSLLFGAARQRYIASHFGKTTAEIVDVETKQVGETQTYRFRPTAIYSSRLVLKYVVDSREYTSEVHMNRIPSFSQGENVPIWYDRRNPNHIELE